LHAEDVEVVRRHLAAEKLHRIAQSGQSERDDIFALEPVENFLAGAEMLKPRHRDRELQEIALPRIRIHVDHASWFLKWKTAQKQIVDQAKDRSVQSNPEREREQRQQSESGRLE